MFHAGVGQHALVVPLPHNEDGCRDKRDQAEKAEQPAAEAAKSGGQHDLVPAQDAKQGAVEQRAGEQGRHQ